MLLATRRGAYLSPDGLAYVGLARNLVDGRGFTPMPGSPAVSNFPPLFPLALAGLASATGADPLTVARYLSPAAAGLTALVVGLLVVRHTGRLALGIAAELLFLAGGDLLASGTSALSEPLFLLLAALAVAALVPNLYRTRPLLLLVAGTLAGAACLTRYVGVAVVVGGAAGLLLWNRSAPRSWRVLGPAVYGLAALGPVAGWLVWLERDTGDTSNRTVAWHPPDLRYFAQGGRSASLWLVPDQVMFPLRAALAGVLALIIVVAGVVTWRRHHRHGGTRTAALVGVIAGSYLAVLVADRALFEVTGRLDHRFLLAAHLAAIGLGLWAVSPVDFSRSHLARIALSVVVGLQVASGVAWVRDAAVDREVRPGGFGAPSWTASEVIDQVRALDPSVPVYSNGVDVLWFHTGHPAKPVPEKRIFLTGKANPDFDAQLAAMAGDLAGGRGLLVYFTKTPARRVFLPTADELAAALHLDVVARDGVGIAYRLRLPTPASPPARGS